MGNTTSTQDGPVYKSLGPSTEQVVEFISQQIDNLYPSEPEFIRTTAYFVVSSKKIGSHREYYARQHKEFITETIKRCLLEKNMRFLVNMILFKIRLKSVVDQFRTEYYRPPNENDPDDKGGKGFQNAVLKGNQAYAALQ